jgi:ubiquinone/menaquinone biosynthesis C-methylase UbiE
MTIFDMIGESYDNTRQADKRIVVRLAELLSLDSGSEIADIGAGTGNYTVALAEAGFRVHAIEPSSAMRRHALLHDDIDWLEGAAENIPLADASVDGVVSTLAVCHFSSIQKALAEMARITRTKSAVIFTFDRDAGRHTWLYEYFPFFWDSFEELPSVKGLAAMLADAMGCKTDVEAFPLPPDLKDNFAAAAWRYPQQYLDAGYRANISSFRKAEPGAVVQGVRKLAEDLTSGVWKQRHGEVMNLQSLDAGYRFVFTCGEEAQITGSMRRGGPRTLA